MKLLFITSNKHKFREAERVLKRYGIILLHVSLRCPEIRADTCDEIALTSASWVLKKLNHRRKLRPFILEDAGLFIRALNGFPGTYSAWVHGKLGNEGILKLMSGARNRRAEFVTALAYFDGNKRKKIKIITGSCAGRISLRARGKGGYGYDPMFIPENHDKTFAEDLETKARVSHRVRALEKLGRRVFHG